MQVNRVETRDKAQEVKQTETDTKERERTETYQSGLEERIRQRIIIASISESKITRYQCYGSAQKEGKEGG